MTFTLQFGTVPSNKKLFDGTVPSNKKLYDGTPKKGRKGEGFGREGGTFP